MKSLYRYFQLDMYFQNRHRRVFLIDEIIRDIFTKMHATFIDTLLTTTSASTFLRARLVLHRCCTDTHD
jgi:hypothetical protein